MKVFLSHSTKDKQFVQTFAAELKAEKIEPWICEVDVELGGNLLLRRFGLDAELEFRRELRRDVVATGRSTSAAARARTPSSSPAEESTSPASTRPPSRSPARRKSQALGEWQHKTNLVPFGRPVVSEQQPSSVCKDFGRYAVHLHRFLTTPQSVEQIEPTSFQETGVRF